MRRTFTIAVRGRSGAVYEFPFVGDPQHLDGWRAEGFAVDEVLNAIPVWVVRLGLTRPWCRAQDWWRWLRLW